MLTGVEHASLLQYGLKRFITLVTCKFKYKVQFKLKTNVITLSCF